MPEERKKNIDNQKKESVSQAGSYSAKRKDNGVGSLREVGEDLRKNKTSFGGGKKKSNFGDEQKRVPSNLSSNKGLAENPIEKAKNMMNHPFARNSSNQNTNPTNQNLFPKRNLNPLSSNFANRKDNQKAAEEGGEIEDSVEAEENLESESRPDFLGIRSRRRQNATSGNAIVSAGIRGFLKKSLPILLPIIVVIIIVFIFMMVVLSSINNFGPLLGIDSTLGNDIGEEFEANDEEEAEFYERVKKVNDEYSDKGITIDAKLIGGVYVILQNYDSNISMSDFDERMIRSVVDAMFDEVEEGETPVYDKDTFVDNLTSDVFPKLIPKVDADLYPTIADEIFEYIEDYKDLIGNIEEEEENGLNNNLYWWPIGSRETTNENGVLFAKGNPTSTNITSYFAGRTDPFTGKVSTHTGMDLTGANGTYGAENIIAALDGEVVYPSSTASAICPSGSNLTCGGGYGNYIVIQHADGNYTLYAHLHTKTILVKAGDHVKQGQVIAKMGSSGRSTGTHLHFEVRVGSNTSSAVTDPLNYISAENPRPVSSGTSGEFSQAFITFLHSWEGLGKKPVGGNYIVYDDGTGTLTVGYGVAIPYNLSRFSQFGIDGKKLKSGSKVPISIVDQIEQMEIEENYRSIQKMLNRENIKDLKSYQIEALLSRYYNVGNVNRFPSMYKKYGNTQQLYNNYMSTPITGKGVGVMPGLVRRRKAEWSLFHEGKYVNN